jgi:hypothetical protein
MREGPINLYIDTQTRPTAAMRRARAEDHEKARRFGEIVNDLAA